MKKTLIALAALAATGAFAQSAVTIDGILDAGYQSINYKGTTVQDIGGNGSSTSQINFRGTEDLGGGMKANFRVETDWNVVSTKANTGSVPASTSTFDKGTAGSFANGEIRVGVSGGFGAIDMGVVNLNSLTSYTTGQPYGTAIGGGFRGVYVTDSSSTSAVRADNSLKYTSPSFAGFNITLYNVIKNTKAGTGVVGDTVYSSTIGAYDHAGVQEIGVNYSNGPLQASYSQNAQDYDGVGTSAYNTTVRTFGANYAVTPALKAYFLTQGVSSSNASLDRSFTSIAGSYSFGANTVSALVGSGVNNNATGAGKTTTMFSLGYDYALSKRTAAYVRYESIKDEGQFISPAAGLDVTATGERARTAVGLRHSF